MAVSLAASVSMVFGYRSMQHHATAVFYYTAWFLPLVVSLFVLGFSCAYVSNSNWYGSKSLHLWDRTSIATGDLVIAILVGSWCVVPLLALSRLCRAIRQTRFANG